VLPLNILGVYRHPLFSNNAIEADRLILEQSLAQLEKVCGLPLTIQMVEEENAPSIRGQFDLVLTMAQREDTLAALEKNLGSSPIWNSSAAIRNCYRMNMSQALIHKPVGYVPFQVLSTAESENLPPFEEGKGYWLKRSDFHAISNDDVTLATGSAEIAEKLEAFRSRGVAQVIVQPNIDGDIYKFYGVQGRFFRAINVKPAPEGKAFTGTPDLKELGRAAALSAETLGVKVFGGDAILDQRGKFHMIDLNDWPSFRICREDASLAIAELAAAHLRTRVETLAARGAATTRA
jgi:hypothetical protein